jgi:hypothetical protein
VGIGLDLVNIFLSKTTKKLVRDALYKEFGVGKTIEALSKLYPSVKLNKELEAKKMELSDKNQTIKIPLVLLLNRSLLFFPLSVFPPEGISWSSCSFIYWNICIAYENNAGGKKYSQKKIKATKRPVSDLKRRGMKIVQV